MLQTFLFQINDATFYSRKKKNVRQFRQKYEADKPSLNGQTNLKVS